MAQYVVLYKVEQKGDPMLPSHRIVIANCLVTSSRSEEDVITEQAAIYGINFVCAAKVLGNEPLSTEDRNLIELNKLYTQW